MQNFSFSQVLVSQLWRTLARKLMRRPTVFITYSQSPYQIIHVYQVLRSEYFLQKFYDRFNIKSTFLKFHDFCEKTYEKTYQFYELLSNFLSLYARWQDFVIWKYLPKKWWLFQNVKNFLFSSATLSNICEKSYEKTYYFFSIFWNFHFVFMCSQNFKIWKWRKNLCHLFEYVNKISFIPPTLNNIFD